MIKSAKTLTFNNQTFEADKIIKTDNSIVGQDVNNNELFAFKGISDFSLFTLEKGKAYDLSEMDLLRQENNLLKAQTQANASMLEFQEELIVELANMVYL